DPQIGFEARGTVISERLNTWRLLNDATTWSGDLSTIPDFIDPARDLRPPESSSSNMKSQTTATGMDTKVNAISKNTTLSSYAYDSDEDPNEYHTNAGQDLPSGLTHFTNHSSMFCGKLYEGYAQVVIDSVDNKQGSQGLFNLESLKEICNIESVLRFDRFPNHKSLFTNDCESFFTTGSTPRCCQSWSLHNYVLCLNKKSDCDAMIQSDLDRVRDLLSLCAPYFHNLLADGCLSSQALIVPNSLTTSKLWHTSIESTSLNCQSMPEECHLCDNWIFTVMNNLVDIDFFAPSQLNSTKMRQDIKLSQTNIFLPLAKGPHLTEYFKTLSSINLAGKITKIAAMDLGLKYSLFEHVIASDTILFVIALLGILTLISVYTWSFIISLATCSIITLSVCLSYVIYVAVIRMPIFPFMNLLAVIISFGICSDNAMLFCKYWDSEDDHDDIERGLSKILPKAIIGTFVASFITSIAFGSSYITKVTAIKCFSIFAMLAVSTNYILIATLLPATLVIHRKFFCVSRQESNEILKLSSYLKRKLNEAGETFHSQIIFDIVSRFRHYMIILLTTVTLMSAVAVFLYPKMSPPNVDELQLMTSEHLFERYDIEYKRRFWFEVLKTKGPTANAHEVYTLPIRVVFGVIPADNGDDRDPFERGTLVYDSKFDMSDPNSQMWLLEFCNRLRQQKFISAPNAPMLSNCFIDTFKDWMDHRKCRDPVYTELDRSPCCQSSSFPYTKSTFEVCLKLALELMQNTPKFTPASSQIGPIFFKNSSRIAAVIIEYYSHQPFTDSHVKMSKFWDEVNDWISWQIKNTAPPQMRCGWFVTNYVDLLALQLELSQGTMSSILIETFISIIALWICTRDIILCLVGALTILSIMLASVTVLILLGWTLNIVESICISLVIGLSVDFALHYTVAFKDWSHLPEAALAVEAGSDEPDDDAADEADTANDVLDSLDDGVVGKIVFSVVVESGFCVVVVVACRKVIVLVIVGAVVDVVDLVSLGLEVVDGFVVVLEPSIDTETEADVADEWLTLSDL
ncbi:Protein dispatched-like 1, partial [Fragariocoptes setiger]